MRAAYEGAPRAPDGMVAEVDETRVTERHHRTELEALRRHRLPGDGFRVPYGPETGYKLLNMLPRESVAWTTPGEAEEDARDAETARARLAGIEADPSCLVSGEALARQLSLWGG